MLPPLLLPYSRAYTHAMTKGYMCPVLFIMFACMQLVLSASDGEFLQLYVSSVQLTFISACNGCQAKAFVKVHEPVRQGKSVMIDCVYDLGGGTLYSINWRFKGREFLRLLKPFHVPSSSSSVSSFHVPSTTTTSSSSPKQQAKPSDRSYTNRQKKPRTTRSPVTASRSVLSQMNMVFTPVPGIEIDVSTSFPLSCKIRILRDLSYSALCLFFECFSSSHLFSCLCCRFVQEQNVHV